MACTFKTSDEILEEAREIYENCYELAHDGLPGACAEHLVKKPEFFESEEARAAVYPIDADIGQHATACWLISEYARRGQIVAQKYLDHFTRINNPDDLSFYILGDWTPVSMGGDHINITRESAISEGPYGPSSPGYAMTWNFYAGMPDCEDIFGGEGKIDDDTLSAQDRSGIRVWLTENIDKYNDVIELVSTSSMDAREAAVYPLFEQWSDSDWSGIWSRLVVMWGEIRHLTVRQARDFIECYRTVAGAGGVVATDCS